MSLLRALLGHWLRSWLRSCGRHAAPPLTGLPPVRLAARLPVLIPRQAEPAPCETTLLDHFDLPRFLDEDPERRRTWGL